MDPQACLQRFIDADKDQDWDEAETAAEDLMVWMARGGFEPKWPPEMTRAAFMAWKRPD
jgi:hypothetical protein